jgi:AmmeMemoRadiSam system protein B
VEFLDEKGLLWTERFEEIKKKAYEKWLKLKVRPMAHAMQAYPLSPAEAKFFVEDILKLADGVEQEETPRVLIAPHIDLRVGARGFAESYTRFKPKPGARIILLGVGHHLDFPISVLTKDFATPFGVVKNDRGGLFFLTQSKKLDLFPDHMAHRREHSLEFQVLFLHHLLGEEFVILPFLAGPFMLFKEHKKLVEEFAQAIAELFDDNTYLVLGIDFCHLGLRYGDPFAVTEKERKEALELDRQLMESSFEGAPEEIERLSRKAEEMKVCGLSCLYLLSMIIKALGKKGESKIYYQDALPFGQGSVVSVASAGINF